jgi:hypothetical protein
MRFRPWAVTLLNKDRPPFSVSNIGWPATIGSMEESRSIATDCLMPA